MPLNNNDFFSEEGNSSNLQIAVKKKDLKEIEALLVKMEKVFDSFEILDIYRQYNNDTKDLLTVAYENDHVESFKLLTDALFRNVPANDVVDFLEERSGRVNQEIKEEREHDDDQLDLNALAIISERLKIYFKIDSLSKILDPEQIEERLVDEKRKELEEEIKRQEEEYPDPDLPLDDPIVQEANKDFIDDGCESYRENVKYLLQSQFFIDERPQEEIEREIILLKSERAAFSERRNFDGNGEEKSLLEKIIDARATDFFAVILNDFPADETSDKISEIFWNDMAVGFARKMKPEDFKKLLESVERHVKSEMFYDSYVKNMLLLSIDPLSENFDIAYDFGKRNLSEDQFKDVFVYNGKDVMFEGAMRENNVADLEKILRLSKDVIGEELTEKLINEVASDKILQRGLNDKTKAWIKKNTPTYQALQERGSNTFLKELGLLDDDLGKDGKNKGSNDNPLGPNNDKQK